MLAQEACDGFWGPLDVLTAGQGPITAFLAISRHPPPGCTSGLGKGGVWGPPKEGGFDPLALLLSTLLVAGTGVSGLTCPAHGAPLSPGDRKLVWLFPEPLTLRNTQCFEGDTVDLHQSTQTTLTALSWHSLGPAQGLQKGTGRGDHRQCCKIVPTGVTFWSQTDRLHGFLAE